jgi:hypothetical protein
MTLPSLSYTPSETYSILFHLADPDVRSPHLLNTRGGTRVLRQGVPAFYDENDDVDDNDVDVDGAIATK